MGSAQSSHTTHTSTTNDDSVSFTLKDQSVAVVAGVRGRKTPTLHDAPEPTERTASVNDEDDDDDDDEMEDLPQPAWSDEEEEDDDDVEDEDDEDLWEERDAILEDARLLKQVANMFLHPEAPITTDGTAMARCYFARPSALEQEKLEDAEERASILEEMASMKTLAVNFTHPEIKVETTDPTVYARNYFLRPSAVQDSDDAEEHAAVLADVLALKQSARQFLHPEDPVRTDGFACGRSFFTRPSAPQMDEDEMEECEAVLNDMAGLKKLAKDYLHPEEAVVTTDPFACGRNFFTRSSAEVDDVQSDDDMMRDLVALKQNALNYLHPEVSVSVEPTLFGRNYFNRPSAVDQEDAEDEAERLAVLADMKALKQLATDYAHPELPVVTSDSYAMGRNYFTRYSAPEQVSFEDVEEEAKLLADMAMLKKSATEFMHPELPVVVSDPTVSSRCYFTRPSAPPHTETDEDEERAQILSEMMEMKKLAADYAHPENPITVDGTSFGRNYFTRASAPVDVDDDSERMAALADMKALKQLATDYVHPELPVVTSDPCAKGRNYFTRYSAPEQVSLEDVEEVSMLLADMATLKKSAVDFMHPELPVVVSDPTVSSRCYFARPSAPPQTEADEEEERAQILSEMMQMKKLAADYAHPENPVAVDATACSRNYFTRASAPCEDLPSEQDLEDISALRKYASYYLHPEVAVEGHGMNCARNYFTRYEAESTESLEEAEERAQVLADALALKKSAVDFMHPEIPIVTSDPAACGRSYFDRFSASTPEQLGMIYSIGHANVGHHGHHHHEMLHDDSDHHEHHDHFEMDEDIFGDFRSSFRYMQDHTVESDAHDKPTGEEEEGKLSRSPSSVMLFDQGLEGF